MPNAAHYGRAANVSSLNSSRCRSPKSGESSKPKKWKMPEWMEPYRECFNNTGGNSIEELMNRCTNVFVNAPLALIELGVRCQVNLLTKLHNEGRLK